MLSCSCRFIHAVSDYLLSSPAVFYLTRNNHFAMCMCLSGAGEGEGVPIFLLAVAANIINQVNDFEQGDGKES